VDKNDACSWRTTRIPLPSRLLFRRLDPAARSGVAACRTRDLVEAATRSPGPLALPRPQHRSTRSTRRGALAAVLLRATVAGVGASYLNQPVEQAAVRVELRDRLHLPGPAQLVLRMGLGTPSNPTPE
jgi:hypothetical protein